MRFSNATEPPDPGGGGERPGTIAWLADQRSLDTSKAEEARRTARDFGLLADAVSAAPSCEEARPQEPTQAEIYAALEREALQDLGAQLTGWGTLLARAASVSTPAEILEVVRGARRALLAAIDEANELVQIENEATE